MGATNCPYDCSINPRPGGVSSRPTYTAEPGILAIMTNSLTEPLLVETDDSLGWIMKELKRQLLLGGPLICVNVLQYAVNLVSIMFVGHLGELELASASIATSFAGVTGYSVLIGMGSALETLCGQAYGAKQYHLLGIYLQRATLVLTAVSIPLACIWLSMNPLLQFIGQDPEISHFAGLYARWLLPSLFAYAVLQPLVKFLQTQSAVLPMVICSALTLCLHIPVCWLLIYYLGVGYRGAAIANCTSQWMNVIFLALYVKFGPTCKKTWTGFSSEALHEMKSFFKLAIPSAVMVCLEYWSFELMVLLSGLLPNPQLEMSALAVSMNTIALMYMIPFGLSAAVSTRVSNELGAGKASAAKRAVAVGISMAFLAGLTMATIAFSARHVWAYAFTSEPEVADYVSSLIPFLAVLTIIDSCQGVLCGVTRGCGNQAFGAYTNLGAYYAVGVPLAVTLAFRYHMNGRGLWLGMIAALSVQATSLLTIAVCTNWDKQAYDALNRVYAEHLPSNGTLVHKEDAESRLIPH